MQRTVLDGRAIDGLARGVQGSRGVQSLTLPLSPPPQNCAVENFIRGRGAATIAAILLAPPGCVRGGDSFDGRDQARELLAAAGADRMADVAEGHAVGGVEAQLWPVPNLDQVMHLGRFGQLTEGFAVGAEGLVEQHGVTEAAPETVIAPRFTRRTITIPHIGASFTSGRSMNRRTHGHHLHTVLRDCAFCHPRRSAVKHHFVQYCWTDPTHSFMLNGRSEFALADKGLPRSLLGADFLRSSLGFVPGHRPEGSVNRVAWGYSARCRKVRCDVQ